MGGRVPPPPPQTVPRVRQTDTKAKPKNIVASSTELGQERSMSAGGDLRLFDQTIIYPTPLSRHPSFPTSGIRNTGKYREKLLRYIISLLSLGQYR